MDGSHLPEGGESNIKKKKKKIGMLVVSLRGVNFRFWSRLVLIRGQKMHEPRPDWSPLGVNFKS